MFICLIIFQQQWFCLYSLYSLRTEKKIIYIYKRPTNRINSTFQLAGLHSLCSLRGFRYIPLPHFGMFFNV
jgi:hypothetical protein